MEFNDRNIIAGDSLDGVFSDELNYYITHAYCTGGSCGVVYNGEQMLMQKGDVMILMANRLVSELQPSDDFCVKTLYISLQFMETCTPHTSYGVAGGLSMYVNPIMRLNDEEQRVCEHDFDEVRRRMEAPYRHFHGDVMMAVTQTMFIDFYEFHARIYGSPEVSALTVSVMQRFIDMLLRGDYRKNREVGYYADALCVTPKYLSEVCKKVSGFTANFWIDRFATIELTRLLKDKSMSLVDIAYKFNFSSQSHFTRYVQKNLGSSPTAFRG